MLHRTKRRIAIAAAILVVIAIGVVVYLKFFRGENNANPTPTPAPTSAPTIEPTKEPTKEPTVAPTKEPTGEPEVSPTAVLTEAPTVEPTPEATPVPTPTEILVIGPTPILPVTLPPTPTVTPTPTPKPTATPKPTKAPTKVPVATPTATPKPTKAPTKAPTPTMAPAVSNGYFVTELAKICGISGNDIAAELSAKGILPYGVASEKIARKDAFVAIYHAAQYLSQSSDSAMVSMAEELSRLSDISKLTAEEKKAAYYVFGNGIVEGKSDGDYTRTRSMKPNDTLTDADTDLYLARFKGEQKKVVLSPDAQVTRTSKITNMDMYPYLLESLPDKFYTTIFKFMASDRYDTGDIVGGKTFKDGGMYSCPKTFIKNHGPNGSQTRYHVLDNEIVKEKLEASVEEYVRKAFSVDYRTTPKDTEWKTYMRDLMQGQVFGENVDEYCDAFIEQYLRLIQENRTIIECDIVRAEASTMYEHGTDKFIRCYVHYRIVSAESTESIKVKVDHLNGNVNPLFMTLSTNHVVMLTNVKPGEWRDGYFDIRLGSNAVQGEEPMKVFVGQQFVDGYAAESIVNY